MPRGQQTRLVVTPDMHRVHHSVVIDESNGNFGFNLLWWDHLFGTYKAHPRAGHLEMKIGVDHLQKNGPTGPAPSFVSTLSGEQRLDLEGDLRRRLPIRDDGRIDLDARAWAVVGFRSLGRRRGPDSDLPDRRI